MIINNFTLSRLEQVEGYTVGHLTSEDGQDWYESQILFDENKLKIEFESNGLITRLSMDVSELWPLGKSVADIELKNIPKGVNEKGMWIFDGVNVVAIPVDYTADAIAQKKELINAASQIIEIIQDAEELDLGRIGESQNLIVWRKYRIELNRVDVSLAPDIKWPEKPSP
ncbi:tail fiber assembly protein [Enterobacteriaceae bacterium H18W14]|uniref:tail fiber assembly protein n=1 Tax=Dryocola boscaweniae TaxID=2925397 RepID=UPI0022F10173|nr:tail fiber assembly protein [Dryocola boscaweniae]MCT4716761.1 tail fiber assembly protein [Dryocola boscaweniae]